MVSARSLLRPVKKNDTVVCLVGARLLLRPEKKKFLSSVWRVRNRYYDRKKKSSSIVFGVTCILSVQNSCAVVSVFLFGGKANLVLLTLFYPTLLALTHRLTDSQTDRETTTLASHGLEELFFYYDRKKKVLVVCLAGA